MYQQVDLSFIFVQLSVYRLYSYHKPPDYGHRSERNILVKNNIMWLNIF